MTEKHLPQAAASRQEESASTTCLLVSVSLLGVVTGNWLLCSGYRSYCSLYLFLSIKKARLKLPAGTS